MIPSERTIVDISYGAALYDCILLIPDKEILKLITGAGLDRFLPQWINLETRIVDENQLKQEVWKTLNGSYLLPPQFRERYAEEQPTPPPHSIPDLNYMLVKEILSISPLGKVNPLVYKLGTARVNQQAGLDTIRQIYDRGLEVIADSEKRKYFTFIQEQVLQTQQRFVDELPLLETVLKKEGQPADLSTIDIGIFFRVSKDGEPIDSHPFL